MDLYIIRHADAVPRGTPGYEDDWSRPLTEAGRAQTRRVGALFHRLELHLDAVVTSPLLRARETVDRMIPELPGPPPDVEIFDEIGGEMRAKRVARFLEKLDKPAVGLVGHEPTLSRFLAWLIGSKKTRLELDKAGVAWLTCESLEKGGAVLQWLVTPDLLPEPEETVP
jgi:phosphohistidine phosphatase